MPIWAGTPVLIGRMLGQVDQDDPTNLPVGCAAVCKNIDFTRDATGAGLSATTRAGNCLIAQGVKSPGTGLIDFQYEPQSADDPFFQQLLRFSLTGTLEREYPAGSGRMIPVPAGMFIPPTNSHKIDAQTANLVFSSYSNLKTPTSGASCYNPKTLNFDPLGMKPYGWNWAPKTYVYAGEVACPSTSNSGQQGNGHTYQAQNSGWTALATDNEPVWPTAEGGTVVEAPVADGQTGVTWKELTMVIANRLPPPTGVDVSRDAGAGTFPAGRDVYILATFVNGMGETIASAASFLPNTNANDAVRVSVPGLGFPTPGWISQLSAPYIPFGLNLYEASVPTGAPAPSQSQYQQVAGSPVGLGSTTIITSDSASGIVVPTLNTARITPGQLPAPVVEPVLTRVSAGQTVAPPGAPALSLVPGSGSFPSGQSVYVLLTLVNAFGETTAGAISSITTTTGSTGVRVSLANSYGPTVTSVRIYEADVTSSSAPPAATAYKLVGSFPLATAPIITTTATGLAPPSSNTATLPLGTFPAGRDIWVRLSYSNNLGETPLGPSNSIINTLANDAVQVTLSAVDAFPQLSIINIYEADVPTGGVEPPINAYALVGSFGVTAVAFITRTATGKSPVTVNGTGPGGNVAADTADGGINATQGYRYAVPAWMNRNETVSGFTSSAASKYIVDEDGWEIAVFNVPLGPANIIGRIINWTVADGTLAGPYAWVGQVNLQIPSQDQVYPNSFQSDTVTIIPTVFLDNVTTKGTFNFTDEFLTGDVSVGGGGNNTTDRLTLGPPPQSVRIDYSLTADALIHSGVPGWTSGLVISLRQDYESYDAAGSYLPIATKSGEICWGTVEFRNQLYAMRERSGIVVTPGTGLPNTWDAKARWSAEGSNGVGPCGPRAFDCNGQFIAFVHRSGFYRYDGEGAPNLMSKEIPRQWSSINWAAAQTICVSIDDDTHTVRIQVPVGRSRVPNKEFCLSYLEGWLNPIHFSTFSQREISQEAARRWSFNDVSAYICKRIYRTASNPAALSAQGISPTPPPPPPPPTPPTVTNATAAIVFPLSRPLGNTVNGALWRNFVLAGVLPADAVIQGIFPVGIASGIFTLPTPPLPALPPFFSSGPNGAGQYFKYGDPVLGNVNPGTFFTNFPNGTSIPFQTYALTQFSGPSIGTDLALLATQKIVAQLNNSLLKDDLADAMTVTGVGYAIPYISATPIIDPLMPPPFAIPPGQGLAWAIPMLVDTTQSPTQGQLDIISDMAVIQPHTGTSWATIATFNYRLVFGPLPAAGQAVSVMNTRMPTPGVYSGIFNGVNLFIATASGTSPLGNFTVIYDSLPGAPLTAETGIALTSSSGGTNTGATQATPAIITSGGGGGGGPVITISPPAPTFSPDDIAQTCSDFYQSQLAYTTTDQSGIINARTPGRFDDNGGGIDSKYMTQSAQDMQKQCKIEGATLSIVGFGPVNCSFLPGRQPLTGNSADKTILRCTPMDLTPHDEDDFTRKPDRKVATYWKMLIDNGNQPGVWFSIKKATTYVIPVRVARGSSN